MNLTDQLLIYLFLKLIIRVVMILIPFLRLLIFDCDLIPILFHSVNERRLKMIFDLSRNFQPTYIH